MERSSTFLLLVLSILLGVDGIMFHLHPNMQKCLKEELQVDVFMSGEYDVTDAPGQKVDYVVRSFISHHLNWFLVIFVAFRCATPRATSSPRKRTSTKESSLL